MDSSSIHTHDILETLIEMADAKDEVIRDIPGLATAIAASLRRKAERTSDLYVAADLYARAGILDTDQ